MLEKAAPFVLLALLAGARPAAAQIKVQCPESDPRRVCMHLAAGDGFLTMADGRSLYAFGFTDVTGVPEDMVMHEGMLKSELPAPTIVVREGQNLYLTLTNVGMVMRPDLFDPHSVHWHGFAQAAPVFDGVPDASVTPNMGASFTYFYAAVEPGTYMYHCHVEAPEHMQMGMLGNLYVLPRQDGAEYEYPPGSGRRYTRFAYNDGDGSTGYDVQVPIQLHSMDSNFHDLHLAVQPLPFAFLKDDYGLLNGRGYPDTVAPGPVLNENGHASQPISALVEARRGERVLLRVSSLSMTRYFTLASGIPMTVVGHGARLLRGPTGRNLYYDTSTLTLGGGESADVILDTARVPPGTYFLYTTNLHYLANGDEPRGGVMTEIVVRP